MKTIHQAYSSNIRCSKHSGNIPTIFCKLLCYFRTIFVIDIAFEHILFQRANSRLLQCIQIALITFRINAMVLQFAGYNGDITMAFINQILGCYISAQPVIRTNAIKQLFCIAIAVDQNYWDLVSLIISNITGRICTQNNNSVKSAAFHDLNVALTGICSGHNQVITSFANLQFNSTQECAIEGISKHDMRFFALIFCLGNHDTNQLRLGVSLHTTGT